MSYRICPSCQGVVGRDCFNPYECQQISQRMQEEQDHDLSQRVTELHQEIDELRAENAKLRGDKALLELDFNELDEKYKALAIYVKERKDLKIK